MPISRFILAVSLALAVAVCAEDVPVPAAPAGADGSIAHTGIVTHDVWEAFLRNRVDEAGRVDYRGAASDQRLREYLYRLANTQPAALPDSAARQAFWINAYNALAIQGVVATLPDDPAAARSYRVVNLPVDGLPASKGFFKGLRFQVAGRRMTLDAIEKQVLLRNWEGLKETELAAYRELAPDHADPRVHFALVCCARGCPRLQRFAYRGETIDTQLDQVTRAFLADAERSRFDTAARIWHVSELLNWYGSDFANPAYRPTAENLFEFTANYVDDDALRSSLRREKWTTAFRQYDWTLNIQD